MMEPEVGFEPTTFRLRVEEPSSSMCRPDPFWLLTSAGSSVECVPDLPSYGRGNDQGNDQSDPWRPTEPWRPSDLDREVVAPTGKPTFRRRGLMVGSAPDQGIAVATANARTVTHTPRCPGLAMTHRWEPDGALRGIRTPNRQIRRLVLHIHTMSLSAVRSGAESN
jgi:hypothetical protein